MNSEEVIDIGSRRELFVDNCLIDQLSGRARLRLHHPHPAGVAFRFDAPWEGRSCGYGTVLKDGNQCRLYYRGFDNTRSAETSVACMAESDDGLTFQRPDLGLIEVFDTQENNVILADSFATHNFAPTIDDRPGVPAEQKYKALASNISKFAEDKGGQVAGLIPYASADGIHWHTLSDEPVITEGNFDSQNVPFWSQHEGCYLCYLRVSKDGKRSIARSTSDDFLNWSEPEQMDFGDTPAEQLYTNQTIPYFRAPHVYISMPGRFWPGRQVLRDDEIDSLGLEQPGPGGVWHDCSDAVLMTSRGGNRYDRTFMESFVRPGLDRRNWTSRCNYPVRGFVQTGESELSMYIERHSKQQSKHVERLTLRLDGFASLSAGYEGGQMQTKPLMFTGSRLTLNYSTSAAGQVRVEIQDRNGNPEPGFSLEECTTIIGDEIERTVTWNVQQDLTTTIGRPVRLLFDLRDADVYSMKIS